MAFCRLVFPLLVLSVVSCYASKVPLYMWGVKSGYSSKANPLQTVPEKDFSALLKTIESKNAEDKLTVVFIEETLSVEDFSRKNREGETSYPYLHSELRNAIYLPSVENALDALTKLADNEKTSITLTENGLSEEIPADSETGNYLFIHLKDAHEGESRANFLRRHDDFMKQTITKMQELNKNVEAIYTAENPSWSIVTPPVTHSRTRRDTKATKSSYIVNGLGLNVVAITLKSVNETIDLGTMSSYNSTINSSNMTAKLDFANGTSINLNFYKSNGYWYFDQVTLTVSTFTEVLKPVDDEVYALVGFSYRCSQGVSFSAINDTRDYTLTFVDMKVQPFFETTNETIVWGESFNCIGYFSAPIWSGLLVVFILLSITFYGIMMMLDIRTMDRFDDPKGKTITINAAE